MKRTKKMGNNLLRRPGSEVIPFSSCVITYIDLLSQWLRNNGLQAWRCSKLWLLKYWLVAESFENSLRLFLSRTTFHGNNNWRGPLQEHTIVIKTQILIYVILGGSLSIRGTLLLKKIILRGYLFEHRVISAKSAKNERFWTVWLSIFALD